MIRVGLTLYRQLVDPAAPPDLPPWDTRTWRPVPDRGAHAAGLLTMPAFLTKYASRRARAAVLYQTFLCKSFVAGKEELSPSKEPNLTIRPGCASCHATLEPLSAYFSRIEEGGWTFLPAWRFPMRNLACRKNAQGRLPGQCGLFYDPDFSDEDAPRGTEPVRGRPRYNRRMGTRVLTSSVTSPKPGIA